MPDATDAIAVPGHDILEGRDYDVFFGDTIPHMMGTMPPDSVDVAITSVPFPSVFAYSNFDADLGNSEDLAGTSKIHFSYFFRGLFRVLKPGRVACIHCMQFYHRERLHGRQDMFDFRAFLLRIAKRAGWLYDGEWLIAKNPQSEAIRTHAHGLLFVTLERDRSKTRPAMGDYVLKLAKPGDNTTPIDSEGISRNEWIQWAESCWRDIRQTNTLNTKEAKGEDDTRHICPLQLDLINRLIRLYTNPGEIVFDPFTGIGSVGYEARKLDRRFYGTEIKREYFDAALKNIRRAEAETRDATPLFNMLEEDNINEPADIAGEMG